VGSRSGELFNVFLLEEFGENQGSELEVVVLLEGWLASGPLLVGRLLKISIKNGQVCLGVHDPSNRDQLSHASS
jgi:hypothetical protein